MLLPSEDKTLEIFYSVNNFFRHNLLGLFASKRTLAECLFYCLLCDIFPQEDLTKLPWGNDKPRLEMVPFPEDSYNAVVIGLNVMKSH